ncbi:hypothetical protein LTR95_007163 [Oleoguttula sp. CCFEE 5521]
MAKSTEPGSKPIAFASSSTPSPPDGQLSDAARVFGIAELLEKILLHVAKSPKLKGASKLAGMAEKLLFDPPDVPRKKAHAAEKAHVIRHLFLLHRVNRAFNSTIKNSLLLRRAMFLEEAGGKHKEMKRNHCLALGGTDSCPSLFLHGKGEDGAIVLVLYYPFDIAGTERSPPAVQKSSWAAMRLANKPCKAELRIAACPVPFPTKTTLLCVMEDPTLGEIVEKFGKMCDLWAWASRARLL